MLATLALTLTTALSGIASAGPAATPGTQRTPPVFVDEPTVRLAISLKSVDRLDGYGFELTTFISGATSDLDRVRLDWKQGGKLVVAQNCVLDVRKNGFAHVSCSYRDKPLTARGAIEADLVYIDDAADKEYLLRTFKVTAAKYTSFGSVEWQLVPDDLLGAAWVSHVYPQEIGDLTGAPHFYFWFAGPWQLDKPTLRCTVNGSKLPDIKVRFESGPAGYLEAAILARSGNQTRYKWTQVDAQASVHFGVRADYKHVPDDYKGVFLGDHAGDWNCQLRSNGNAIRELAFTVDDKGFISSDLQTASNAPPTATNTAAVILRFPPGAKHDGRIRPDAMKKSRGFGLPWPDAPSIKSIHASFPAASGWPDPK